jgi:hypothetical protein
MQALAIAEGFEEGEYVAAMLPRRATGRWPGRADARATCMLPASPLCPYRPITARAERIISC